MRKGEWPERDLDHKNHDTMDDRIENLRLATMSQNLANSKLRVNNTSGFKGVHFHKGTAKWAAQIKVKGKHLYLGLYATPAKAHAVYMRAAKRYFGEFACGG